MKNLVIDKMESFEIIAINKRWILVTFIILFLLLISAVPIILLTDVLFVIFPVIFMIIVFMYGKRYFTKPVTLKPIEGGFKILSRNRTQVISYDDLDNYKVERLDGIRMDFQLKNRQKINITATNNFGSTPEPLEAFSTFFEAQIKNYQGESSLIKKKESFFKTKTALLLTIILTVFGIGGLILGIVKGREVGVEVFVIIIPLIMLWLAISSSRRNH